MITLKKQFWFKTLQLFLRYRESKILAYARTSQTQQDVAATSPSYLPPGSASLKLVPPNCSAPPQL